MNPTSFAKLAQTRRSVRAYKADPVPDDLLHQVLEAGRLAPSAVNKQPWRFIVVRDENNRRALGAAYAAGLAVGRHGSCSPAARSRRAVRISGRPTSAVGSSLWMASSRAMPRPSLFALPAQS